MKQRHRQKETSRRKAAQHGPDPLDRSCRRRTVFVIKVEQAEQDLEQEVAFDLDDGGVEA